MIFDRVAPVMSANARQARTIRRLVRDGERKDETIARLTARLRRIQLDVDLMACCIPRERRADALALVRDRHRIEDGRIIEEAW